MEPMSTQKPQGAEFPPRVKVRLSSTGCAMGAESERDYRYGAIDVMSYENYISMKEHENLLNEVYAKCPNEEWECTKVQRKLEAKITSLEAMLEEKQKRIEVLEAALKDAEKIIAGSVGSTTRLCEELWASSKSQEWIKNKMLSMPLLIEIKEYYAKRREALAASAKGE